MFVFIRFSERILEYLVKLFPSVYLSMPASGAGWDLCWIISFLSTDPFIPLISFNNAKRKIPLDCCLDTSGHQSDSVTAELHCSLNVSIDIRLPYIRRAILSIIMKLGGLNIVQSFNSITQQDGNHSNRITQVLLWVTDRHKRKKYLYLFYSCLLNNQVELVLVFWPCLNIDIVLNTFIIKTPLKPFTPHLLQHRISLSVTWLE